MKITAIEAPIVLAMLLYLWIRRADRSSSTRLTSPPPLVVRWIWNRSSLPHPFFVMGQRQVGGGGI